MRYFKNSRPLQISIGLSTLLHLCFFLYLYSLPPFKKTENTPIAVDYISPPKEEQKIGRAYVSIKKEHTMPRGAVPEPYAAPPPSVLQENQSPAAAEEPRTSPVPHSLELPKAPALPNLIPSPERLAKIEEGKAGEESEEETISLNSPDLEYLSYRLGVSSKLNGIIRYPEAAIKYALQGEGVVRITIERDGSVSEIKIIESSGYPIFDEDAVRTVKVAAPFNPFADNMPVKRLKIELIFTYGYLVQPGWKRYR